MSYFAKVTVQSRACFVERTFSLRKGCWKTLLLSVLLAPFAAQADFVAFVGGGNTAPLPFTLSITNSGSPGTTSTGTIPASGTPAYTTFNGQVNFTTSLGIVQEFPKPFWSAYIFSRLNPNRRYSLKGTTVRGGGYLNRYTLFELDNAASLSNAHTANCLTSLKVSSLASNQVAFNTGANDTADTGDIFDWEDVQPGPDGTLIIRCSQYTGFVPGGSSAGEYAYNIAFLRVQEFGTNVGPVVITQQPTNQTNAPGASASFSVQAHGYGSTLSYHWMKNGIVIPGATQPSYTISSLSPSHAGVYSVEISNAFYKVTSTNAELILAPPQPEILVQPSSVLGLEGSNVNFTVSARGAPTLKYQWQFNGTNLPGATASNLTRSAWASNAGPYRVVVTNTSGLAISGDAILDTTTLGQVLDTTNLVWGMDGSSVFWFPQTNVTHIGSTALQTGRFTNGAQLGSLSTTVIGPGTLRFWWKMNASNPSALYQFSIDGASQTSRREQVDWQRMVFHLGSNAHTLAWRLFNNGSLASDVVAGWVDEVSFLPGIQAPVFLFGPSNQTVLEGQPARFTTSVEAPLPISYQWQFNSADILGQTNSYLSLLNAYGSNAGTYSVTVSNAGGSVAASASLNVQSSAPVFLVQQTNVFTTLDGEVWLHAKVAGSEPIYYQWLYEGSPVAGQTNSVLKLPRVRSEDQGRYSVIASNAFGITPGPFLNVQLARVTRVLHISVDGLAAIQLGQALKSDPLRYPRFNRILQEGSWTLNARCDSSNSVTVPNHLSMLTGRPVLQPEGQSATVPHGYTRDDSPNGATIHNSGNTNVSYKASVFDVVHDRGGSTAFLAGKTTLSICVESYNDGSGAEDLEGENNGRTKVDLIRYGATPFLVPEVVTNFLSGSPRQYTFLHIAEPDVTGHSSVWGSPAWLDTVEQVDG